MFSVTVASSKTLYTNAKSRHSCCRMSSRSPRAHPSTQTTKVCLYRCMSLNVLQYYNIPAIDKLPEKIIKDEIKGFFLYGINHFCLMKQVFNPQNHTAVVVLAAT